MNRRNPDHPESDPDGTGTPSNTPGLITLPQAAKRWNRSVASIKREIKHFGYREENGVFFTYLEEREWRINEYLFLFGRRLPVSAAGDVRRYQFADFYLQQTEQGLNAMVVTRRLMLAEREAAALLLDAADPKSNHAGVKRAS